MSKPCYLIANWKLTHSFRTVRVWLPSFATMYEPSSAIHIGIAPSFTELNYVGQELKKMALTEVSLVSQSVSSYAQGKYTGEVGAFQLSDLDVSIGLVGHSERRQHTHESNEVVIEQIKRLQEQNIQPLVAVSELSEVDAIVESNVNYTKCMWAYEPVSAIGSGNPADPDQVKEILKQIRQRVGPDAVCLYGGSIDAKTVKPFTKSIGVDGFLVGTASVDVVEFIELHQQLKKIYEKA